MKRAQFVVGIDLGTTHCALAAARLEHPQVFLLRIAQLTAPGEVQELELLPSFMYLPLVGELTDTERELPWGPAEHIIGKYARRRGQVSPNRLVASAKSWVCHNAVNRRAAILPWSAPDSEPHVSPYQAQVSYLAHLERAWRTKYPEAPLAEQDVVVTVPASFDEGARALTSEAAQEAGLGAVRLLEEPQAAFYDYLGALAEQNQKPAGLSQPPNTLDGAKLILVVDMGGGTTDLTLLRTVSSGAMDGSGLPTIERIAVGGHLLLGGDNMDAALAVFALQKAKLPRPEDATVWSGLIHSARDAKERLLAADAPAEAIISYQGRGSRLIGSTKSVVITRDEALTLLLDGCFPRTSPDEVGERTARAGLTSLGLPYVSDTAVPRHVCSFLRRHALSAEQAGATVKDGLPRPDLLLLNGGVFKAPALIERLQEVFAGWYDEGPPALLQHTSLETAVALGAVRSGLARHGLGTTIGGGTAKAYYIGVEHNGATRALCIAPRHVAEGTRITIPDQLFELRLNEPVAFPLFAYTGDRPDAAGAWVDIAQSKEADALEALAPLRTLLRGNKNAAIRETSLAVSLESFLDESGDLHLELVSAELPPRRFKLEFAVFEQPARVESVEDFGSATASTEVEDPADPRAAQAAYLLTTAFSSGSEERVGSLRLDLEEMLGPRGQWSGATCRVLFDACLSVETQRSQSALFELTWLRHVSWTLRPGFGSAGDKERMARLWSLQAFGPAVPNKANWGEWWIMWRRVAAGLDGEMQKELLIKVRPSLWPQGKSSPGEQLQGIVEMMRMVAALERIDQADKVKAGALFIEQVKKLGSYWPLGRVGARALFHGAPSAVVDARWAETWIEQLLLLDLSKAEGATFALASMARLTGDSARDVDPQLRNRVVERLTAAGAPPTWVDMVLRASELDRGDLKSVLGDSLPPGLRLRASS